eukprot:symbB.v1.2.011418.t1/scaffold761.1/size164655/3
MGSFPLMASLGELEIEECAKVLEQTSFAAGEEIIRQGEEGLDCFIVDSGECYASIPINGEWKEVLKYEPGGFFGERALLRKEGRAATVTARSDVKLLKLSREEFVSMIEERDHKAKDSAVIVADSVERLDAGGKVKTKSILATAFSHLHEAATSFLNNAKSDWKMGGRSNLFVAASYLQAQSRPNLG